MNENNDKRLCFTRIAEGDKKAFDAFFEQYYPKLLQFARIFVQSQPLAEDVVAEVLTNMLAQRERVFRLEHFEAYLYSSIKNKALSSLKKQNRVKNFPDDVQNHKSLNSVSTDPHTLLVVKEMDTIVAEVIRSFPPKRHMVFQLIKEEGFSYRKVAELMNISERTVEVHLRMAVKSLRERIEQYIEEEHTKK